MRSLFSYVVDHDLGISPNPYGPFCTLVKCKFGKGGRRNIVELANVGDWIVGTGGVSRSSAGHGKLIYAMRVDEKLALDEYCTSRRFSDRSDAQIPSSQWPERFALVSSHFYYFGRNAIDISRIPLGRLDHPLEKRFSGFRRDFTEDFIASFCDWLLANFKLGMQGEPCGTEIEQAVEVQLKRQDAKAPCTPERDRAANSRCKTGSNKTNRLIR